MQINFLSSTPLQNISRLPSGVSFHIWLFFKFDLWKEQLFKDKISNFLPNTYLIKGEVSITLRHQSKSTSKASQNLGCFYISSLQTIWGCWRWIWGVKYEVLNMKWSVKYEVLNACRPSAGMSPFPLLSSLTFFVGRRFIMSSDVVLLNEIPYDVDLATWMFLRMQNRRLPRYAIYVWSCYRNVWTSRIGDCHLCMILLHECLRMQNRRLPRYAIYVWSCYRNV